MSIWTEDQLVLLNKWISRINREARDYRYYAIVYARTYYIFGVIVASALAILSTAGILSMIIELCPEEEPTCETKYVLDWVNIFLDIIEAALISVFTFLDFSGHAEKCRTRKIELDALSRTIEESKVFTSIGSTPGCTTQEWIHNINKQYHEIQKKQIILGLGWLCMSKKELLRMNPLDESSPRILEGTDSCDINIQGAYMKKEISTAFTKKYRENRIFKNSEAEYQLNRLNDSEV